MSQQSEERYWTDYVRVATPIVGLLLLLGVFWYWANSLIGAESTSPPPTTVLTVIPDDTPTPTATIELDEEDTPVPTEGSVETEVIEPTNTPEGEETPPTRTPRSAEPSETPDEADAEVTEEPSGNGGTFEEGQSVEISSNDVRMRSKATTDSNIVATYDEGVELIIIDGTPQEGDGYVWWNVRNETDDSEGWVVEDWLRSPS